MVTMTLVHQYDTTSLGGESDILNIMLWNAPPHPEPQLNLFDCFRALSELFCNWHGRRRTGTASLKATD